MFGFIRRYRKMKKAYRETREAIESVLEFYGVIENIAAKERLTPVLSQTKKEILEAKEAIEDMLK